MLETLILIGLVIGAIIFAVGVVSRSGIKKEIEKPLKEVKEQDTELKLHNIEVFIKLMSGEEFKLEYKQELYEGEQNLYLGHKEYNISNWNEYEVDKGKNSVARPYYSYKQLPELEDLENRNISTLVFTYNDKVYHLSREKIKYISFKRTLRETKKVKCYYVE